MTPSSQPQTMGNRLLAKLLSLPTGGPEISDRIVEISADLTRKPVSKTALLTEFAFSAPAIRVIRSLPTRDDNETIDPDPVDRLMITVHCEMQRLSEEFQQGPRMAELLNPLIKAIDQTKKIRPLRVIDIGCGTGFVLRWLAAKRALPANVQLVGADYHAALIEEARRLAAAENLAVNFKVANAFQLAEPASIYISTGILHHFRGRELVDLFAQHVRPETQAFVHFDFHQSVFAPFGSWLFHVARMRQPLARYDGVLSAVRAYTVKDLLTAAREGAPEFKTAVFGVRLWGLPIPRAFHCLVGLRSEYYRQFLSNMGTKVASLGVVE